MARSWRLLRLVERKRICHAAANRRMDPSDLPTLASDCSELQTDAVLQSPEFSQEPLSFVIRVFGSHGESVDLLIDDERVSF